jgi:hydroxymethylbilane synthase
MRIGTRASALALAQARSIADALGGEAEIVTVSTDGDRGLAGGDKARWTSALERALLADRIDIAVHSAKDVPARLPDGLELIAVPARADARDAICGAPSLAALPAGARVGTSSLRRAAQIRALRPDIEVVAVRGNVDTRLRALDEGVVDGLVLALAGLTRLGLAHRAGGILDELVPAAGQGALAIEARAGRGEQLASVRRLADPLSELCVAAERELIAALGADCGSAVGAHAVAVDQRAAAVDQRAAAVEEASGTSRGECPPGAQRTPGQVLLRAWVGLADGSAWIADRLAGPPTQVGAAVAERMLAAGAAELLGAGAAELLGGGAP